MIGVSRLIPASLSRACLLWSYRLGGWPRRLLAATCLLLAAGSALAERARPHAGTPLTRAVVVAARDLPAGRTLLAADVQIARWAAADVPATTATGTPQVVGRSLGAALGRGEPLTATRLRGPGIAAGLPPGTVAVAVALTSSAAGHFIRAGDRVDLLLAPADPAGPVAAPSRVLAGDIRVLDVVTGDTATDPTGTGTSLLVAVDHAAALRIAAVPGTAVLATLRPPP